MELIGKEEKMQASATFPIYVNGKKLSASEDDNLLELLRENGFDIPTLCYHTALPSYGACRLCSVEVKERKRNRIVTSCTFPVRNEGIEVFTKSDDVVELRKMIIQFLLSRAPSIEIIQELAKTYGVEKETRFVTETMSSKAEGKREEKCILCGICVRVCNDMLQKNAISFVSRGINRKVASPFEEPPEDCIGCGACSFVCPTGAIDAKIQNSKKYIEPWGAEFELVRCSECDEIFLPLETIKETESKIKTYLNKVDFNICLKCKRKLAVKSFKESKSPFY